MRKTRGQIGSRVARGVARIGRRRNPHRSPLAGQPVRPDPAVASRLAGARGVSAPGVDYVARLSTYQTQNGPPYKLTPRQHRRVQHKLHHQEAQAGRAIDRRRVTVGGAVHG